MSNFGFEKLDLSVLDRLNIPPIDDSTLVNPNSGPEIAQVEDTPVETRGTRMPKYISEADLVQKGPVFVESMAALEKEDEKGTETSTEDTTETPESTTVEDETQSPRKVFAEWLGEQSLITYKPEEFEDGDEFIANKWREQVDSVATKQIEEWKQRLPEEIHQLVEHYEQGVPLNKLIDIESRIAEYSAIKPGDLDSNVDLQKSLIREMLTATGAYTPKEAEAEIAEIEDTRPDLLLKRAQFALPKLISMENEAKAYEVRVAKEQVQEAQTRAQNAIEAFKNSIETKEELIPGYKLDAPSRKKVIDSLTKVVGRDNNGNPINLIGKRRMEDPYFDAKVAYVAEVLGFNFEAAERKGATKATVAAKKSAAENKTVSKLGSVDINLIKRALKKK